MNLTTSYVVNGDDFPVNNINDLLPVHDDSIHSDGPGIPVGSKVLAQQRKVLLTEMGTEGFLRIILTPLKPLYDYIIIDTNWATSPLMINARTAADGDGAHLFCFVGLSNKLDGEFARRKPAKRSHREVVRAAVMDSELLGEVIEGEKSVTGVKALLVLPVAALHLAVVARRVGTDELVADPQLGGCGLKQGRQIPLAVGEAVGELKSIVSLDTFHADTSAGVPLEQLFQEIGGGTGGLFRVGR